MVTKEYDALGMYISVKSKPVVSMQDMLNGLKFVELDDTLPRDLRIIEDATQAVVSFTEKEICVLYAEIDKISAKYERIRHAVIHTSPVNTAFTMIMSSKLKATNYKLEVFSTVKAAMHWLSVRK